MPYLGRYKDSHVCTPCRAAGLAIRPRCRRRGGDRGCKCSTKSGCLVAAVHERSALFVPPLRKVVETTADARKSQLGLAAHR
jgi:hypothetical protein